VEKEVLGDLSPTSPPAPILVTPQRSVLNSQQTTINYLKARIRFCF